MPKGSAERGLTIIELMIVIGIIGVVAAIAFPKYQDYRERIRVNTAKQDIAVISASVRSYMADNKDPPVDISGLLQNKLDPWGRPYQYQLLQGIKGVAGKARKNKNLVPLNSDFDLYSMGKDGDTAGPLNVPVSRDDVLRANDGAFIGLASDYE
jgi:general secretion pathway protein G